MSPEYTYWDERRRERARGVSIVILLVGLLLGLAAGGASAWVLLHPGDLLRRLEALEARVGAVERGQPEHVEALETRIDKLAVQVGLLVSRAEHVERLLAETPSKTPGVAAVPRSRPERAERAPVSPGLRLRGIINTDGRRAALVEDGQDHGYVVQVGGDLAGGRVVDIRDDTVVVQSASGATFTIRMPR